MRLFNSLLFMASIGLLFSCSKSNDKTNAGKLKKVTETNYGQQTEYGYDNNVLITTHSTNLGSSNESSYQYPADRLSVIQVKESQPNSGDISKKYKIAFKYENQGRLSEALLEYDNAFPPGDKDITRYEFFYTGQDDNFSSCITYSQTAGGEVNNSRYVFKYDARGNISEYTCYKWEGNNWGVYVGHRYTYANVANPTWQLGNPLDFLNYYSKDLWVESNVSANAPYINLIPKIQRSYLLDFNKRVVSVKYPGNQQTFYY